MFLLSNVLKKSVCRLYLSLQARTKTKTHWAKLKKKTGPKYKALHHFDDFYGSVFGKTWEPMRHAMLRRSKYVAVVNNYGDPDRTTDFLMNKGAHCLKNLMSIQQDFHHKFNLTPQPDAKSITDSKLQDYMNKVQYEDISSVYPQTAEIPEKLEVVDLSLENRSDIEISSNINTERNGNQIIPTSDTLFDSSRIIDPAMGITTEALYQYIPATKLKGMDDWVPESLHYSYYNKEKDFPLKIDVETEFKYPEHLKVYTYEMDSENLMFPEPKKGQTGVFNYYPMDCGSVLSVLALCLSPGDRVLDLCSAPGGKALVALQTLLPDIVVCNDSSLSRLNRIERMFSEYLYDFKTSNKWHERVLLSKVDGRSFVDDQGFDKVLVDVPCTTDRHSLMEDENNIFRPDRIKERLRLPEIQSQLLTNALRLVRVGGAVVYSTCSLSPIQNDGVVHMALKQAFEEHGVIANIRDLTDAWVGLSSTLSLATGAIAPQYGQLVMPSVGANFGPSYIARLVRVK